MARLQKAVRHRVATGMLGVQPAFGRGFRPDETGQNSPDVIVLTDELWKRLGRNPNIIGTELKVGRTPFSVIGVMPPGFRFSGSWDEPPDAYGPLTSTLRLSFPITTTIVESFAHAAARRLKK